MFKNILTPLCLEKDVFRMKQNSLIPIEIRLMICLRILGRGEYFDTVSELCRASKSAVELIFKLFVVNFSESFFDTYIRQPTDERVIKETMNTYAKLGLPGAIGSMDVTHVHWAACPTILRHECKGKESDPTLAFQVIVNHMRLILYVSDIFHGPVNDKIITRNDSFPRELMEGSFLDIPYCLYDEQGRPRVCRGVYLIVDGGYFKCGAMMDPSTDGFERNEILWSEWV